MKVVITEPPVVCLFNRGQCEINCLVSEEYSNFMQGRRIANIITLKKLDG